MATPWSQVASSPQYQALPPSEQEAARTEYFNTVVAPQVGPEELPAVKQEFDSSTAPKSFMSKATDTAVDAAKSFGTGLVKGGIGVAGLPGNVANLMKTGVNKAIDYGADKVFGSHSQPSPDAPDINGYLTSGAIQKGVESLTGPFYKPQTGVGQVAGKIGEYAPGAVALPGGMASNFLRFGVAPAIADETAGKMTEGTALEPWARTGAALLAGGVAAASQRPNTAERMVAAAGSNVTPQQYQAAQALVQDAAGRGITLTPAEAIQHVTGGATRLGDLQRITESTTEGGQRMAAALAERPAQMQAATEDALNTVAARPAQPSYLGPQMQEAGQGVLDRVRQSINRLSEPYYNAAETVRIPPNEYAQMAALPGFQEAFEAVRNTPQLNRYVAHLPDDSVGVLNEVKKQLDTMAQGAVSHANPTANAQIGAGYTTDANAVTQMGRQLSPDYAQALDIQARGRTQVLDPLAAGPVGRITASRDHVAQGNALMGDRPSPQEVTRATADLLAQNPQATTGLIREHLGRAADATVGGLDSAGRPDQFGGAKFARDMSGGRDAHNIAAALNAANPHAAQNVSALVDALAATGWRQRPGSLTAFNQEALKDMKSGGVQAYVGALMKPMQKATDSVQRLRLGSQANTLADLLLSGPGGVSRIEDLAANGTGNARALAQALLTENSAHQSGR